MSDNNYTRDKKGESLLKLIDEYTLLDIETTGLDPMYDSIIEIGAIRVKDNIIVDEYNSLVNPNCSLPQFITNLTGITNEMVSNAPTIEELLPRFMDYIKGQILVGHYIHFDINFLYDNILQLLGVPLSNDFICTHRMGKRLFPELKSHKLSILTEEFNIKKRNHHRAIQDCYSTNDLYDYYKQHINNNNIDINKAFAKKTYSYNLNEIKSEKDSFDISHPLYGQNIVFTGKLEKMVRKEAARRAVDFGAICQDGINKETNILILGNNDYNPNVIDGKSLKQKKVEDMQLKGHDIMIMSENVFYDLLFSE